LKQAVSNGYDMSPGADGVEAMAKCGNLMMMMSPGEPQEKLYEDM
jgi:hypothetical protein